MLRVRDQRRASARPLFALAAVGVVLCVSAQPSRSTTPADDPGTPASASASPEPHRYQGAFWGLGLHAGFVYRLNARSGDVPGPAIALSARLASILSLADFQLTLQGSTYSATSSQDQGVEVKRLSVGLQVHLHPLFLQHLQNSNFWFWAAGIYVSAGMSVEVTDLAVGATTTTQVDPGWTLGAGMDYPLTDVHEGWSLWIGASYRVRFLEVSSGISGLGNFNEHEVLLTLGYRNNNIFAVRAPRPTELDYREPSP